MTGHCIKITWPGEQSWLTTYLESIAITSPGCLPIQHPLTNQGSIYSPRIWNNSAEVWYIIFFNLQEIRVVWILTTHLWVQGTSSSLTSKTMPGVPGVVSTSIQILHIKQVTNIQGFHQGLWPFLNPLLILRYLVYVEVSLLCFIPTTVCIAADSIVYQVALLPSNNGLCSSR